MIVAVSDIFALAAKAVTTTIPIVYIGGNDPARIGLVSSLSSPGGNVTGVTVLNVEIAAKRLQLLNEMIPTASTIAALLDPATPNLEIELAKLSRCRQSSWCAGSYRAGGHSCRGRLGD